jgi:diaminopimelate epimerase
MQVPFAKYQGLGNDFVVVDLERVGAAPTAEQTVQLCDRHLGIGADGVLVVSGKGHRPTMRVINADGSVPEMCGNGIRCVALHLLRTGRTPTDGRLLIDTDSGPHACRVLYDADSVEVGMRPPALAPELVPVLADGPVIDAPFEVLGREVRITAVSMGNPHAVTFDDVNADRHKVAPLLQRHPRFPQHANVGFARMLGADRIDLDVFERGAGWTRACGTGACAAAVAAVETGRAQRGAPIQVRLPGGILQITVNEPGETLIMTGPARHVFDGVIDL